MEKILEKSGNFVSPGKWEPWWSRLRDVSFWLRLSSGKIKVKMFTLCLQRMYWARTPYYAGTTRLICRRESPCFSSRWNSSLNGWRMRRKVSTSRSVKGYFTQWVLVTPSPVYNWWKDMKEIAHLSSSRHNRRNLLVLYNQMIVLPELVASKASG